MTRAIEQFRRYVLDRIHRFRESGTPSRNAYLAAADQILKRRLTEKIPGIWEHPPLMLTATLEDGFGHGLEVIHRFADAAGLRCMPLGLLLEPERIVRECRSHRPDFLGMTVLQFDSEDALKGIRKDIPSRTRIVAGGPVFRSDSGFHQRTGIDRVARDGIDFLKILLNTDL